MCSLATHKTHFEKGMRTKTLGTFRAKATCWGIFSFIFWPGQNELLLVRVIELGVSTQYDSFHHLATEPPNVCNWQIRLLWRTIPYTSSRLLSLPHPLLFTSSRMRTQILRSVWIQFHGINRGFRDKVFAFSSSFLNKIKNYFILFSVLFTKHDVYFYLPSLK